MNNSIKCLIEASRWKYEIHPEDYVRLLMRPLNKSAAESSMNIPWSLFNQVRNILEAMGLEIETSLYMGKDEIAVTIKHGGINLRSSGYVAHSL